MARTYDRARANRVLALLEGTPFEHHARRVQEPDVVLAMQSAAEEHLANWRYTGSYVINEALAQVQYDELQMEEGQEADEFSNVLSLAFTEGYWEEIAREELHELPEHRHMQSFEEMFGSLELPETKQRLLRFVETGAF